MTSLDDVRYLLIVNREDGRLYRHAVRTFAQRPYVRVIYDRRQGERRRTTEASPVERRQADRRARSRVDAEIRTYGSAMVRAEARHVQRVAGQPPGEGSPAR